MFCFNSKPNLCEYYSQSGLGKEKAGEEFGFQVAEQEPALAWFSCTNGGISPFQYRLKAFIILLISLLFV